MSKTHSLAEKSRIEKVLGKKPLNIHFIGVGGVGMYSLFMLSKRLGYSCSGSDTSMGELAARLIKSGERVWIGSRPNELSRVDIGVYTLAAADDDSEIMYLEEKGALVVSRAEFFGAVLPRFETRIGVSGSHGKSTVVAMLAEIFGYCGREANVICGAALKSGEPFSFMGEKEIIYEACEYKNSFLSFEPTHSVFLNLEYDHVDFFSDINMLKNSFCEAYELADTVFINSDDNNLLEIAENKKKPPIKFGFGEDADFRAEKLCENSGLYSFTVCFEGKRRQVELKVAGKFNVYNALAAISAAVTVGVPIDVAAEALSQFQGISRRLEYIGRTERASFFYDYAHHPTEIKAGIAAIRERTGLPVSVIFRPHTYSRTSGLFFDFCNALSEADKVYLLEIDGIREQNNDSVSSLSLVQSIGEKAELLSDETLSDTDFNSFFGAVIVMGAADMSRVLKKIHFIYKKY